jgi:hypothetical protein
LSFSPQTGKLVKMFWVFHPVFQLKIDGKQTTFFTKNSAENFEFSNQCMQGERNHGTPISSQRNVTQFGGMHKHGNRAGQRQE